MEVILEVETWVPLITLLNSCRFRYGSAYCITVKATTGIHIIPSLFKSTYSQERAAFETFTFLRFQRDSKDSGLEFIEGYWGPFSARASVLQQPYEVVIAPILQMRKTVAMINEATVPTCHNASKDGAILNICACLFAAPMVFRQGIWG